MKNPKSNHHLKVEQFYEDVTEDYQLWNKESHMHFGYSKSLLDIFSNTRSLRNLTRKVLQQFSDAPLQLIDLGCGMGGSLIQAHKEFPQYQITGVTLSSAQVAIGNTNLEPLDSQNRILQGDYENLVFRDGSFEGAYAIESFCHSGCSLKSIQESARLIKPGGKLVIADAFTRTPFLPKRALQFKYAMEKKWRLKELISIETLYDRLTEAGFKVKRIEDLSWHMAPSIARVPFTLLKFYISYLWKGKKISKTSKDNAWASFYALLCGLYVRFFGYYLIVAYKD